MAAAASSPPGSRGVLFLPHMSGASCPVVDPTSMGALVGLRNFVTKSDIQRAVIEGLDYQFLDIIEAYRRGLSVSPERIVAIGGATNNEFWMQNKADVVGKPIEVPALDEAVPLGAAILAGIGSGVYRDEAEAFTTVRRPGRVYEPDPALSSRYRESYETWSALYTAIRPVHTQLHSQPAGH
jgi:xylulokinase